MIDLFTRYRRLSPAERIRAAGLVAAELFRRLAEHGGATPDELRQVAAGLTREWEDQAACRVAQATPIEGHA